MRKSKRALALILAALLLCSVLLGFSGALFLVRYPVHTCCGERCLYCGVLNAVDALLHQSGILPGAVLLGAVLLAGFFSCAKCVHRFRLSVRTPITLKTKLLN